MSSSSKNRVLIRSAAPDDCEAFLSAVRRSRALHGSWIMPKAKTPAEFARYLERYKSASHCGFLVIHRDSGDLVGVININDIVRGAFQSAALGYYAFAPHAGQGLMQEGLRLVITHAFKKLKLHRLEACIQPANLASIALVKKCGFVREGLSRRLFKIRGRWQDHERWALLAEDFPSRP